MRNKLQELELFLDEFQCDILCLNEHWLKVDECQMYIPVGFKFLTGYFRSHMENGGVSIFIKSDLSHTAKVIDLNHLVHEGQTEMAAIHLPELKIVVVSLYCTPKTDNKVCVHHIDELLMYLLKFKNHKILIIGDINTDVTIQDSKSRLLLDSLKSHNFTCLNNKPTRLNACLDNVISNISKEEVVLNVVKPLLSDHDGIFF